MAERVLPDWVREKQRKVIWLDDDHAVTWTFAQSDGVINGGLLWHRTVDTTHGGWCCGAFFTRPTGNPQGVDIWKLESIEPLTLSPSFLCHCGHHGFIRNGTWVQA